MAKAIDLTGNKYGKLTVIARAEDQVTREGKRFVQFLCKCECGNTTIVRSSSLRSGATSSCGCGKKGGKRTGRPRKESEEKNRANICIDCKKACGGCSWSARDPVTGKLLWQPVPGWTAEEVPLMLYQSRKGYTRMETTYKITACPEFERDERQCYSDSRELSKEESDHFLADIRRILRRWADEEVQCVRG